LTIALAAFAAGTGWSGAASAQSAKSSESPIEVERAQHELTVAENVLRDARAARAKTETAIAQRLARLDEQRRSALALPDSAQRQTALRATTAEQERARAERAQARAAEAAAERNVDAAALALARLRFGTPPAKPASAPAPAPAAAAVPAPAPTPATSLEALIHVRMDVESAETALARAKAAREDIERKAGAEVRDLARQLADAVEQRKRIKPGEPLAQAAELEARIKARIQEATAKVSGAETREAEAGAALEAARAREARVRAEIEARLPAAPR
jgi:hypothetical protein